MSLLLNDTQLFYYLQVSNNYYKYFAKADG